MANAQSPTHVLKIFLNICMQSCKKFQKLISKCLSGLDSDPNYQKTFVVSLLKVKIFNWLIFLVLMRDVESKVLEKNFSYK